MVSEFSTFAVTGYFKPEAPPAVNGSISGLAYWYEGLADWVSLTDIPPTVPLGTALHLLVWWINESAESISGHIELTITKPDGSNVVPSAMLNQNNWANPGNGWAVQFEPIMLDQLGTYQAKAVLSTMGEILSERIVNVAIVVGAKFVYVSAIGRKPLNAADYFYVDVQNIGNVAGTCTLEFWTKHLYDWNHYERTPWKLYTTVVHVLQPGEIKTFGDGAECRCNVTGGDSHKRWYVKFVGEPGEIYREGKAWA